MPRWILSCPDCHHEFTYRPVETPTDQVRDPFLWPPKPHMAADGTPLPCPRCKKTSHFQAFDLRFRAE